MRISLNWVRSLLGVDRLPLPVPDLVQRLTQRTAEIEHEVLRTGPGLDGVVVGAVLTCVPHPGADRLRCCVVDIGAGAPVPIVCGAPNVAAGQRVAVATVGAVLSGKDGSRFTIKAAKLRGEPSHGMICAEDEIGLGTGHDGILVLDPGLVPGTPLAEALGVGDTVLQVENIAITHRIDLWGHWGWAREIAALCALPAPAPPDIAWTPDPGPWSATLADAGGRAYAGAVITGVAQGPAPAWMAARLEAAGVRPLGLLIDVTNYVMLTLGQPMHAFDRRRIAGTALVVRAAAAGERLATLDGRTVDLACDDLVVADAAQPLALAGILGGVTSAVAADTTEIVLEAAQFSPERIRRTRKRLGLATDSSARSEKGPQPEHLPAAINLAIRLLAEACPGARVLHRFHAGALAGAERIVPIDPDLPSRTLGVPIPPEEAWSHLVAMGCAPTSNGVRIPWWRRRDLARDCDLVEEIGRCHGYDRIQPASPRLPAAVPAPDPLRLAEHRTRRVLSAHGWDEVTTYAFTSQAWAEALAWPAPLTLSHPMSSQMTVLRASLAPTLLEAVAANRRHAPRVAIYEVGKAYAAGIGTGEAPDERMCVAGACAAAGDETPVYAARDAALALLAGLGYPGHAIPDPGAAGTLLIPGRSLRLRVAGADVGEAGEIAKSHRDRAGLTDRAGFFRLDLQGLIARLGPARPQAHHAPSRFPAVSRDVTWECPESLAFGEIAGAARQAAGDLLVDLALVSVYRGEPYAADRKAVCVTLTFQANDRTLAESDLARLHQRIIDRVQRSGAVLRG
jgi:phenylalanyl-tRNA synthetase beta chain